MGRGDRKTRKGKIAIRSYGNVRPHTTAKKAVVTKTTVKAAAKKTVAKVAPAVTPKKVASKKPAA